MIHIQFLYLGKNKPTNFITFQDTSSQIVGIKRIDNC